MNAPDKPNSVAATLANLSAMLSFHIAHLARSGLVDSRQESRFIFYSANFAVMDNLITYLTDNCCQGEPSLTRRTPCP